MKDHLLLIVWIWSWGGILVLELTPCSKVGNGWDILQGIITNFSGVFLGKFSERAVISQSEIISVLCVHGTTSSVICDTDTGTNGWLNKWHSLSVVSTQKKKICMIFFSYATIYMPLYTLPNHISGENRRTPDILPRLQEIDETRWRLFIDSRFATENAPFDFVVDLWEDLPRNRFENVSRVDMIMATIPKVANEDYVILDIRELRDSNVDSNAPSADQYFSVLYFDNSTLNPGDVKVIDKCFQQCQVFNPPISALSKLSIRVVKGDGTLVSTTETGTKKNVTLVFDIILTPSPQGG
jgi:hypothetical protein